MSMDRRDFLKGTAWMGVLAATAGCASGRFGFGTGGSMQGFAPKPMKRVRVAFSGVGGRGSAAVRRVSAIPGVEVVALNDRVESKIRANADWLKGKGLPEPKAFGGEEGWKALCDWDGADVVYVASPWALHAPTALRAMRNGKIPLVEVPSALTLDECWDLVETSEETRIPCMQLENCCYGEIEMLEFNMAKLGVLGELTHAEGAYIHDLRHMTNPEAVGEAEWRYFENRDHKGNRYPTHGLVPICLMMDVNRGDRFDYLVSLESQQANFKAYMKAKFPQGNLRAADEVAMGDMNVTLVKTVRGRSIMVQHDVSSPRPYNRLALVSGTLGTVGDYPFRVALSEKPGDAAHAWFDEAKTREIREKYRHPLWKKVGEIAKKVGGHGGMDFIMDLRWAYCLQNGLPLDMDVYDLATTCSLCELTEISVRNRSKSVDVPDFTRGGWRTAKPLGIVDVDMSWLGCGTGAKSV